jgi:FkbM family methyltransferase
MSLLTRALGFYFRTGARGSFRLTDFLANRLKSLQNVGIKTPSGTLFVDLRISSARAILAYPESITGEDLAMRNFVRTGDTILDIGAHFGFYTLLLSELAGENGRVFAFEPNTELLPSLRKTVKTLTNVELLEIALSDREGKVDLFVPEDASMASLSDWTKGNAGVVHTVSCEMKRLDDLVEAGTLPVPQFIKCDVEGAELSIFKGAVKTLNRADAPVIMFEVNEKAAASFGVSVNDYFDLLESLSIPVYQFFEVLPNEIKELECRKIEFANVIAVPKARNT